MEPVRHSKEDKHWYYPHDSCEYKSLKKSHAKRHVSETSHTKAKRLDARERPFKCDLCDYSAARNYHLTCHKRRIHGVKPEKTRQTNKINSSDPKRKMEIISEKAPGMF